MSIQKLPWKQYIGFGFGHIFNDMCASMWFSYLIIYLNKIVLLNNYKCGVIIFIGQFCDAIATPIIGI